jgi:hypothetical protein
MTALYEIADEYSQVFQTLSEQGFDYETIENTLEPIAKTFEEKAKNVVAWVTNVNSELKELEEHKSNIDKRIKTRKSEVEFYRNYIKNNMLKINKKKITFPLFDLLIKNTTPKLIKDDEMSIPFDYIKSETITKIDDAKLKRDLEDGAVVPGAYLQENHSLTIKLK